MGNPLDIGVVGCGIAGLSVAILLQRQRHRITIFDQFDAPLPLGSGLVIQPVGQAVLAELGVLEQALGHGARITRMVGRVAGSTRAALDARYGGTGEGRFGLGMHRAALFDLLLQRARLEGTQMVAAAKVTGAPLAGRRMVATANGPTYGPFDLVIDAAGANSPLSSQPGRLLAYGALWATVDWPDGVTEHTAELRQTYRAARNMLGVLPIGTLPGDPLRKSAIFWSLRQDSFATWRATPLADWKAQVVSLWPEFAPFLRSISSHDRLTMARYRHGQLRSPIEERLVHIGDAWHVASPQLGQGANMALLDAQALALAFEGGSEIAGALARFHALRRRHLALYQLASRLFTPMYQSDSRILPILRDRILTPVSAWPFVRPAISRLVAGDLIPPLASRALPSPRTSG